MLAEPPLARVTEWARVADAGSGCQGSERVCVRNRVPDATTRRGLCKGRGRVSCVSFLLRDIRDIQQGLSVNLGYWVCFGLERRR